MLNRRATNYIFYGSLVLIVALVIFGRYAFLNNINTKIANITEENKRLVSQIDTLESTVQDNKNLQKDHIFDLYDYIPDVYSEQLLSFKISSMLEELGIDESRDSQRAVFVGTTSLDQNHVLEPLTRDYLVIEISIRFSADNEDIVNEFIQKMNDDDQLFILDTLEHSIPSDGDSVFVELEFYAFYAEEREIEQEQEES